MDVCFKPLFDPERTGRQISIGSWHRGIKLMKPKKLLARMGLTYRSGLTIGDIILRARVNGVALANFVPATEWKGTWLESIRFSCQRDLPFLIYGGQGFNTGYSPALGHLCEWAYVEVPHTRKVCTSPVYFAVDVSA